MKKFLVLVLSLFISMSLFAADAPDLFVKKTADEVFEILKTDKDLKAGNKEKAYKVTEEKILPYFDFDRISKLVLGKAFNAATKEEQEAFKKEFRTMLVKTYGSALLKFKDQKYRKKFALVEKKKRLLKFTFTFLVNYFKALNNKKALNFMQLRAIVNNEEILYKEIIKFEIVSQK